MPPIIVNKIPVPKPKKDAMPANIQNKPRDDIVKSWLPVLVFMGLIFYASSIPGSDIPSLFPFQDVVFHLSVYLMLAFFFSRALRNTYPNFTVSRVILITILFGVFYGMTDEFHQAFVPLRTCSGFDLFIDGVGSLIGSLIFTIRKVLLNAIKLSNGISND